MTFRHRAILLLTCALTSAPAAAAPGPSARTLYTRALEREQAIRTSDPPAAADEVRKTIEAYESVVRRCPTSGYSDNALWQAANLALFVSQQYGDESDKKTAVRLLTHLKTEYPASSLVARADELIRGLAAPPAPVATAGGPASDAPPVPSRSPASPIATIRDIKRTTIPEGTRVIIEMDTETSYETLPIVNWDRCACGNSSLPSTPR